jgi:hypothetical protein
MSLQSHFILTLSHWSSGLPVCFPSQGTRVQNPWGDLLCETRILLLVVLATHRLYTFTYSVHKYVTVCVMYVHTVEVTVVYYCPTYCCSQLNGSDLARRPISQAAGVWYGKTLMVCNDNSWQSRFWSNWQMRPDQLTWNTSGGPAL